jgi:tetratricopeptide (TPR) repeat protein
MTITQLRVLAVSAALACAAARPAGILGAGQQAPRLVLTDDGAELDAALTAKTPPRDVAVRLAGVSLPDADPARTRLLLLADIDAGQTAASLVSVSYVVENERGQPQGKALRRKELAPTADGALAFSDTVSVPPGTYRIKLAAMRNNRVGAASATVNVRVQSMGTLRLGDLLVGESTGGDLRSSTSFDRRIRGDRLVASFALAGAPTPADVTMTAGVAKDAGSPALLSAAASAEAGTEPVRLAQAILDLRALPQGEYEARVVVSSGGRELGRVTALFTRERSAASAASAAPAAKARGRSAGAPLTAGGFQADVVLDPAVLRPFLDELSLRAPDSAKGAIEQAKAGRFADAAKSAAASKDPNDPTRPFLQGVWLLSERQLQAASESFRDTLRVAPDYFAGAFYIGACYAAGGRDPQAVNAWQTSLVGLEQYPIVYRLLGEALTRMGQPEKALDALDEALAKWPDDSGIRVRVARAALDAKRYERVVELVDGALERKPAPDLLFVGMQALFEQSAARPEAASAETVSRIKRYRDAYAAAGGTQQALVGEWVSAVEKKK